MVRSNKTDAGAVMTTGHSRSVVAATREFEVPFVMRSSPFLYHILIDVVNARMAGLLLNLTKPCSIKDV